jgi:hypothetical protein
VADQIQFFADGSIHSMDGQVLNRGVQHPSAMSDSAKAGINIALRDGSLHTFNSHSGNAQVAPATTTVQLKAATGLVKVPGTPHEVTPEVLERMKETSPELFESPEAAKAEAKAVATDAAKEAADRADLNRYKEDAVEGVAMHISSDVEFGDQVRVLHELHTTGTVSTATLNKVADQLHLSVSDTVDALNAVHTHSNLQLAAMCGANGVDAQAFATWFKGNDPNAFFKSVQIATQDRDIVKAWSGPIAAWKARGQR